MFYSDERQIQRARKKRKVITWIVFFGLVLIATGGGYAVVFSEVFQLKEITIRDESRDAYRKKINETQFINDLKEYLKNQSWSAGLLASAGENNIFIWEGDLEPFLLKHREVQSIAISRDYFKRVALIEITRRERYGILCEKKIEHGGCWWFDREGMIFEEAPEIEGALIKKLQDYSGQSRRIGEKIFSRDIFTKNLIGIFDSLSQARGGMLTLSLENPEDQEVIGEGNNFPRTYFSIRNNTDFIVTAFKSLETVGLENIEYIDLRVENRVYYKKK